MKDKKACPFCKPDSSRVFYRGKLVLGLWDAFPVNDGHALLVPKRHVASWFDATEEERAELMAAVDIARDAILAKYKPDGFNLGINIDHAAGQTVFHLHLHVIPRYTGDVEDPTGGVRNVVPQRGNYLMGPLGEPDGVAETQTVYWIADRISAPHTEPLICGETDPLLPHLLTHLDSADRADFAVSFVLESGTQLLLPHFQDLLDRGGRLRLLTSDYLGITDPYAVTRLLDLQEQNPDAVELRIFQCRGSHFHPKAYIFHGPFGAPGNGIAYVGSSPKGVSPPKGSPPKGSSLDIGQKTIQRLSNCPMSRLDPFALPKLSNVQT
jgi:diadenosine tetraphosphate (Ap4A) HIT family hydrolase